ncbi:BRCA1-associated protein [Teleopsis dalmanni]|uniref:BRCA1-associated protein n=1 Tax=Teleopsis dalmanni TaxID=139649 RepID=UPI0018CDB9F2|nr:BRCA1-associated protein [Teleopsis dalmanni]
MPNKISICIIKIEIDSTVNSDYGAVSAEHPTNPRLLKERERDHGLRKPSEIIIETFTNQFIILESEKDISAMRRRHEVPTSTSRETTPLEEGQNPTEFPKEIAYFSGNPSVEVTNGIIHLYKKNERKEIKEAPSNQLCLLAVPTILTCHDLLSFIAPCHSKIQHVRIIRDASPNQFMVLLEFRSNESALDFYQTFNGAPYNSLEPDSVCHAVWVSSVERGDDGLPPLGHTELPTCPVCLERMDESVDGVLTILCNHAFHAGCLIKWGDSTCPVCRHVQTPQSLEDSVCMECEGTDSLWICLICGHVGCGRYQGGHAAAHYRATNHAFAMQLGSSSVWDYAGDNFVHRVMQNKSDGKLVATQSPDDEGEEKIDSMQLEFSYLLTSQLETQRKYFEERLLEVETRWKSTEMSAEYQKKKLNEFEQKVNTLTKEKQALERKLAQNATKLKEVQKQLSDENQISKALQTNQSSWQSKFHSLEKEYQEYRVAHEAELAAVKEELRDVMFYMSAQSQIANSELKDEIETGQVVVPEQEAKPTGSSKAQRRKKHR